MLLINLKARSYSASATIYINNIFYIYIKHLFIIYFPSKIFILTFTLQETRQFFRTSLCTTISSSSHVYRFLGLTVKFDGSREQSHLGVWPFVFSAEAPIPVDSPLQHVAGDRIEQRARDGGVWLFIVACIAKRARGSETFVRRDRQLRRAVRLRQDRRFPRQFVASRFHRRNRLRGW